MLTTTATALTMVKDCRSKHASSMSVNRPEVENNMVVVATLVLANAAFVKYCKKNSYSFVHNLVTSKNFLYISKVSKAHVLKYGMELIMVKFLLII